MRFVFVLLLALDAIHAGDSAPARVVSLAPSVTETIISLGLGDRLVARTRFCPVPPGGGEIAVIEDMVQPSLERILGLRPDLILASDPTPALVIDRMNQVGLRAVRLTTGGLDSVFANVERIGVLLGAADAGRALTGRMRADLARIETQVAEVSQDRRPRAVLFYGTDTEFCAGPGSFAGEILERAGGRNVAGDADAPWPRLNRERLLAWNPEVILVALTENPADLKAARSLAEGWKTDPLWRQLAAVRTGRIVWVTGSLLMIPGPRTGEAAQAVAAVLHPNLFPEIHSPEIHFHDGGAPSQP